MLREKSADGLAYIGTHTLVYCRSRRIQKPGPQYSPIYRHPSTIRPFHLTFGMDVARENKKRQPRRL
jgi:hypothetical protein